MYNLKTSQVDIQFQLQSTQIVETTFEHLEKAFSLEESFVLSREEQDILKYSYGELLVEGKSFLFVGLSKQGNLFSSKFTLENAENQNNIQKDASDAFNLIKSAIELNNPHSATLILVFIEDLDTFFPYGSHELEQLDEYLSWKNFVLLNLKNN